jgi:hypothetical protein
MRASTLTNVATISLVLATLAACDGSGTEPPAAGGDGGSAGTEGGNAGGTGGTGGSPVGADANADQRDVGGSGGGAMEGGAMEGGAMEGGAMEGGAKEGGEAADGDAAGGRGGSTGDAEAGPGGSTGDAEGGPGGSTGDAEGGVIDMCSTPLTGMAPFGAALFANVPFPVDGGTRTEPVNAQVYFPAGRLPGAAVILTGGNVGPGPFAPTVARSTLDSAASVNALSVSDSCGNGIADGSLVEPPSGLTGTAILNIDPFMSSDALVLVRAPARLCPNGAVPGAAVASAPMEIWPTSSIALTLTTPVDLATRANVKIKDSNRPLTVTGGETNSIVYVTPQTGAFPPGDLALDVAGLTDVLGRSYSQLVTLKVQKPTTAIADRTLTTPPSSTAWVAASANLTTRDGLLVIEPSLAASQLAVTIGLGDEPGSKTLRIKHRWVCAGPTMPPKSTKLVASDGAVVDVPGNCAGAPEDTTVTLAGAGPFFLVVQTGGERSPRCSYPSPPLRDNWELDEFAFAP